MSDEGPFLTRAEAQSGMSSSRAARSVKRPAGDHARLTNLPLQLTTFVGRRREIGEVQRLLETTRLLTLTGAGGAGKTRLALSVADMLVDETVAGYLRARRVLILLDN